MNASGIAEDYQAISAGGQQPGKKALVQITE